MGVLSTIHVALCLGCWFLFGPTSAYVARADDKPSPTKPPEETVTPVDDGPGQHQPPPGRAIERPESRQDAGATNAIRQKRLLRWTMKFNTNDGDDYRKQLAG